MGLLWEWRLNEREKTERLGLKRMLLSRLVHWVTFMKHVVFCVPDIFLVTNKEDHRLMHLSVIWICSFKVSFQVFCLFLKNLVVCHLKKLIIRTFKKYVLDTGPLSAMYMLQISSPTLWLAFLLSWRCLFAYVSFNFHVVFSHFLYN